MLTSNLVALRWRSGLGGLRGLEALPIAPRSDDEHVSSAARFPPSLRSSTVPRWSHRDPVEGDNPFSADDSRHETWHTASRRARETLVRIDREIEEQPPTGQHPDQYPVRLVALAVSRFDVWAKRCLCIVWDDVALRDYERWLADYTLRWPIYVAETCPKVDVSEPMRVTLQRRSRYWLDEARRHTLSRA